MKRYHALVIGSGLSGMSMALLLARRGWRVALTEQGRQLAPLLAGFDRAGVHFETGLHYSSCLGPGEVGRFLLDELGVNAAVQPCAADGHDEIRLPTGRRFKMVCGRERLAEALSVEFPAERDGIVRYLELSRSAAEQSGFLHAHRCGWSRDILPRQRGGPTLQEVLDELFVSPELKAIFSASTFLHGAPPSRVLFEHHSLIVSGMFDSMWEMPGGGRALAAAFRQALERAGVEILLNAPAEKIELTANGDKVVSLKNHPPLTVNRCVSTIHPRDFFSIAPPEIYRAGYLARARQVPDTTGFFCLYATACGSQRYHHNNIFLLPELDFSKIQPDGNATPYYVNFSHGKPQAVNIIVFVPADGDLVDRARPGYRELKQSAAETHRQRLAELCPDVAKNLQFIGAATPGTQKFFTGSGAGYGLMHDATHTPLFPVTKIPGLYLAGQSVVAPGLLGAIISAFVVDQIISAELS